MDGATPADGCGSPFERADHALVCASFIMRAAPTNEPTAPISTNQYPKPRLVAAGLSAIRYATARIAAKNVSAKSNVFRVKPRNPPGGYCTLPNRTSATSTPAMTAKIGMSVATGKSPESHALELSLKFATSCRNSPNQGRKRCARGCSGRWSRYPRTRGCSIASSGSPAVTRPGRRAEHDRDQTGGAGRVRGLVGPGAAVEGALGI